MATTMRPLGEGHISIRIGPNIRVAVVAAPSYLDTRVLPESLRT